MFLGVNIPIMEMLDMSETTADRNKNVGTRITWVLKEYPAATPFIMGLRRGSS